MVAAMVAATAVAGNGGAQTLRRPVCPEQKREDQVQRCEGFVFHAKGHCCQRRLGGMTPKKQRPAIHSNPSRHATGTPGTGRLAKARRLRVEGNPTERRPPPSPPTAAKAAAVVADVAAHSESQRFSR